MKIEQIQATLESMGYRSMDDAKLMYGKPIGYHILLFDINLKQLSNSFVNHQGKYCCYNLHKAIYDNEPNLLQQIREFEAFGKFHINGDHNFNF